jgi:SAM-dependent methyltransferase
MQSLSVRAAMWYLSLLPAEPPDYWERPAPGAPITTRRAQMEYDDELAGSDAFTRLYGLDPKGLDLLDLGCGHGGRPVRYAELGAKSVTGIEVDPAVVAEGRVFAASRNIPVRIEQAVGEHLPFPDESFDAIYSYDVFEHVNHLPSVLHECYRVLRPGGILTAVLPPVHHPTGGSHFHGYVSRSPAPTMFFRPRTLIAAAWRLMDDRGQRERPTIRPGDYLPAVNGTTVRQFFDHLAIIPFSAKRVELPPIRSRKAFFLNPVFMVGARVPLMREVCVERIVARLTK